MCMMQVVPPPINIHLVLPRCHRMSPESRPAEVVDTVHARQIWLCPCRSLPSLQACRTLGSSTFRPQRKSMDNHNILTRNTTSHQRCLGETANMAPESRESPTRIRAKTSKTQSWLFSPQGHSSSFGAHLSLPLR